MMGIQRLTFTRFLSSAITTLLFAGFVTVVVGTQASAYPYAGTRVDCSQSSYVCVTGGYAGSEPWGYYTTFGSRDAAGRLHNCTSYAAFRASQNGAARPTWHGNANEWDDKARAAGTAVDHNPAVGAIAQWNPGTGHVAYVESVDAGGILITEDNWGLNLARRVYISRGSGAWPEWFIHLADGSGRNGSDPIGNVEVLSGADAGTLALGGWVLDPDAPTSSTTVHVYIDGPAGSGRLLGTLDAGNDRPDVGSVIPGAGAAHGFSGAFTGQTPGAHGIWIYGINIAGAGTNPLLKTATITIPAGTAGSPFGSLDIATGQPGNALRVAGWTIDPDSTSTPTDVHIYIDGPAGLGGRGLAAITADGSRPDVANAFPGAGDHHGYDATLTGITPGRHTAWVYAINRTGSGSNPLLRTLTFTVPGP